MAWKRAKGNGRLFSEKQKDRMVQMVLDGKSKAEVIKEVGCHRSCLDYILVERFGTPTVKPGMKPKGAKKIDVEETGPALDEGERDYLLWALRGALNKVGGASYVDRLIADIRDGRLD
jgi:hypothetical protein